MGHWGGEARAAGLTLLMPGWQLHCIVEAC